MSAAEIGNLISSAISLFGTLGALLSQLTISVTYLNNFLGVAWGATSTVVGFVNNISGGVNSIVQFFVGLF